MLTIRQRLESRLIQLYGPERTPEILARIISFIGTAQPAERNHLPLTERDIILITYGDQVATPGQTPLTALHSFLSRTVKGVINTVHLLPFYPYSSDDGFSVIDYEAVNSDLGTWDDIRRLKQDFRLMFDAVFNHISAQSRWFQGFLRDEAAYRDYFITVDPATDLSAVRRPRALPLLTPFETARGKEYLWTTFSDDQIDLNLANPDVLLELIRLLLFYVRQGAALIRLDAIGFLWKTIGTDCIHLPQTHTIIQVMRDVLDLAAPEVVLITETNVPHEENIAYFGDGRNEAQMVYQFSLPPLLVHTFRTGDAAALSRWAATIRRVSSQTTFFNFTASHDGIGVQPARGILTEAETAALVSLAEEHGGFVSYRNNSDGTRSPYELNINFFDAITSPEISARQPDKAIRRFLCSQAVMLAFMGVPGVYFHSLFGSRSDHAGVKLTGRYRSINRQKFEMASLQAELNKPAGLRQQVFREYLRLLTLRIGEAAFHPAGEQTVLDLAPSVFALERLSPDGKDRIVALHHVGDTPIDIVLPVSGTWHDIITGQSYTASRSLTLTLTPYQIAWLKLR